MNHKEALKSFIDYLKKNNRSESTIVAYRKDIEQLFGYYDEDVSHIKEYKTSHLEKYITVLIEEKKFTLKTVSRKINSYKTLFKFLTGHNIVKTNISLPISHPKFETKAPRILSSLEYKALRDTTRGNTRLYAIVELLLQTGIRIGELSRLKISDIDLDSNSPSVYIAAFSSNSQRRIPLNKEVIQALKAYLKIRPKVEGDEGYLFITKTGRQVLVRNIRSMVNNAFKKSGIENATVNDIRNTFIVYQLEHGMPLERVAEMVGHQRLTSTEKYLQIVKDRKKVKTGKITPL